MLLRISLACCIVLALFVSAHAGDWGEYLDGQFVIEVAQDPATIDGSSLDTYLKTTLYATPAMSDLQLFVCGGAQWRGLAVYTGWIENWLGYDPVMLGTSSTVSEGRWTVITEIDALFNSHFTPDYYVFGCADYQFHLSGVELTIGPNFEMQAKEPVTTAFGGLHVGHGAYKLGFYASDVGYYARVDLCTSVF